MTPREFGSLTEKVFLPEGQALRGSLAHGKELAEFVCEYPSQQLGRKTVGDADDVVLRGRVRRRVGDRARLQRNGIDPDLRRLALAVPQLEVLTPVLGPTRLKGVQLLAQDNGGNRAHVPPRS
ncbi:hypothetical protein ACWGI8_18065 [Streptomyces sp. NPDC054841]